MMKRSMLFLAGAVWILGAGNLHADLVSVDVYGGHTTSGGGTPYSGLVGSFTANDVQFATNTGYAWHPFGLGAFGADITGILAVAGDGTYAFTLNSDDGSLLFIAGSLVVDNGGPHGPGIASGSAFLAAGNHPFEVQFFEDFGGPSGVDLYLPSGVTYTVVPVPGAALLAVLGLATAGALRRRRAVA